MNNEQQKQTLNKDLEDQRFKSDKDDFSSLKVFNKNVQVKGFIRMKNFTANPTNALVGDIAVINGILKICTVAGVTPTWTTVGSQ